MTTLLPHQILFSESFPGMFGASRGAGGKLFDNWLQPGNLFLTNYGNNLPAGAVPLDCKSGVTQSPLLPVSTCDPKTLTTLEFVGPDTSNPDKTVLPRNRMNFGPAIGFSWQVPWFGEGKTTVRGGYSIQYQRIAVREDIMAPASGGNTRDQQAAITETGRSTEDSGRQRKIIGTKGEYEVTAELNRSTDSTTKVEITARKSAVEYDKELAKDILNRILTTSDK